MSKRAFDRLTDGEKEIFIKSAIEAGNYERDVVKQQTDEYISLLKNAGVEINYPDKAAFVKAVEPIYSKYEKSYGQIVKKIKGIGNEG
jgi:TRAP-type C4-dicarboxylate transport system substrate-binding protein